VRLGTAQRQAGDPSSRDTLLGAARMAQHHGHTDLLVRAALANNRGYFSIAGAVDEQRVVALDAALSATAGTRTPERAMLLATLAAELTWVDPSRARALSDEALVTARSVEDDLTLLGVLSRRPFSIWTPATLDERTANAYEQRQVAERLGDQHLVVEAARSLCNAATCCGDLVEVDEAFDLTIRYASETRLINSRSLLVRGLGWRHLLAGHIGEAEKAADEGLQIASEIGDIDALPVYAGQIYDIRRAQGRLDEILDMIEQTASENPGLPIYRASLAHALCEVDRLDDARIVFEPLVANGFTEFPFDLAWLTAMTMSAEAAAYLEHRSAAALLAERLAPWRHQLAYTAMTCTGSVARPLGLALATAGRLDEADEAFGEAAAVHERIKAPIELARTQVNWARMLASRCQPGDLDRASALLHRASTTASELGLATIQRQTQSLLTSLVVN
jgi:tetratricopeptide (TPR) repeat protein